METYTRHNIRATSFYIPPRHVTTHELPSSVRATSGAFQSSRDPPPRAAGSDTSCTRLGRSRHPEKCCRAWLGLGLGLGLDPNPNSDPHPHSHPHPHPNPNPEKCRRASPGYSSGRGGKSGQVSCSVSSSAGGSLCEKARPMWPASQNISANWPRLAEAGGRPELDLALAGRARGRIGRSPWAAGFHTGSSLSAVPIMVMQVSADGLRKVSVHRPSCVSSAWRERVVRSAPSAGTRASPQRRRRR